MLSILLLAFAQGAQNPTAETPPTPEPAASARPAWRPLNQPALIVNEELLTMFELQVDVERDARLRNNPITSPEDRQRRLNSAVTERAKEMLRVQGGKDMGFDPDMVERLIERYLDQEREEAGTLTDLAERLAREDRDRFRRENEVSEHIYGRLWEEAAIGKSPSQGGRVSHDRYVRPGRLWFEFRDLPPSAEVQLTQLIVLPNEKESFEEARARTEALRQRVLAGEDMGQFAEDFGSTESKTRGLSEYIKEDALRAAYPDIWRYLQKSRPGDLSETLRYDSQNGKRGWIVVRLEDRRIAPIPPFDDPLFQRRLNQRVQANLDNLRSGLGLDLLLNSAYVWPPEAFGPRR